MSVTSLNLGDVVRMRWPYTDMEGAKNRPALVLSVPDERGDCELAMITKNLDDTMAIRIQEDHYRSTNRLPLPSAVRTDRRMTIAVDILERLTVSLKPEFVSQVKKAIILKHTRDFSSQTHAQNRPGIDPRHPHNQVVRDVSSSSSGEKAEDSELEPETRTGDASSIPVPYAGRVFTEDEVEAAVSSTLDFWLTLGSEGSAFEKELADYLGVKSCVLTNSGSSANLLAVSALTTHKLPKEKRLLPGDEVITCAAGFPTTVAPILQNKLVPVFLDNDPITGNADLSRLEEAYVPGKTKAVMMAHTLGNPFDLATVCEFCHKHELWLIEDNCDALGCTYTLPLEKAKAIGLQHLIKQAVRVDSSSSSSSGEKDDSNSNSKLELTPATIHKDSNSELELLTAPTGAFGHLSTQSFYPPHHLTMGEGGSINIIRKAGLRIYVESFRDWGRDCWCPSGVDNTCNKRFGWQLGELPEGYDHKYIYSHIGYNIKPLDPQAAIGRQQLKKLPAFVEARKHNWEILRRGLAGLEHYFEFSLPTHAVRWVAPAERGTVRVDSSSSSEKMESVFQWKDGSIASSDRKTTHSTSNSNSKLELTGYAVSPSWFGFMLLVKPSAPFTKSAFAAHLDEHKVGNRMLFGGNLLRQPAFVQLKKDNPNSFRVVGEVRVDSSSSSGEKGDSNSQLELQPASPSNSNSQLELQTPAYPGADRIMNEAIFVGVYPGLTDAHLEHMVLTIREFCEERGAESRKQRA